MDAASRTLKIERTYRTSNGRFGIVYELDGRKAASLAPERLARTTATPRDKHVQQLAVFLTRARKKKKKRREYK